MTKSSEFIIAFSALNDQIVAAIADRSFGRVIMLDKARQEMMQHLCLIAVDEVDDKLFEFIENCTYQNTQMIENLELEVEKLTFRNNRFNKAVENKNPGNITMWPINKRITTKTMYPVHSTLYYEGFNGQVYKYPNKVFFESTSSKCDLYPNDIEALMDLLTEFEAKNC